MEKLMKFTDFVRDALLPEIKKAGVGPFGMAYAPAEMNGKDADAPIDLFLIIPYKSLREFLVLRDKLCSEAALAAKFMEYKKDFSSKDPGYDSAESMLLKNFKMMPEVEVPTLSEDRIMQLRYYRSFDEERNAAKISMFEEGGELELFRKYGMNPVFFGEAVFGTFLPNLTYMISFANQEAKDAGWKAFVESPEWAVLSKDPLYADTATNILNYNLRPCKGSEI